MEKYLNKLIEQFKTATGTKNVDVNSQAFIQEFSEWIKSRQIIGNEYGSFIEYMCENPEICNSSVEIGKGKYDSIVLGTDIPMITPYSDGIKRTPAGIITANFGVYEGTPIIVRHNKGGNQLETVDTQTVRRFLTQNPYEQSCIRNWEQLHNAGDNITVGVFGSIYDKDIEQKIKQIEALKSGLIDDSFKEEYAIEHDMYCYAISSTRKVKTLTRSR